MVCYKHGAVIIVMVVVVIIMVVAVTIVIDFMIAFDYILLN